MNLKMWYGKDTNKLPLYWYIYCLSKYTSQNINLFDSTYDCESCRKLWTSLVISLLHFLHPWSNPENIKIFREYFSGAHKRSQKIFCDLLCRSQKIFCGLLCPPEKYSLNILRFSGLLDRSREGIGWKKTPKSIIYINKSEQYI